MQSLYPKVNSNYALAGWNQYLPKPVYLRLLRILLSFRAGDVRENDIVVSTSPPEKVGRRTIHEANGEEDQLSVCVAHGRRKRYVEKN